jgi:hypothetical protein
MNRNRQRLSQDSILYCRSYALEAERKMGQILAETERAVGTDKAGRSKKLDGNRALPSNPATTNTRSRIGHVMLPKLPPSTSLA